MSTKTSKEVAEKLFETFVATRRNLRNRDWETDVNREEKDYLISLIMAGEVNVIEEKKTLLYKLETPINKETDKVEFIPRVSRNQIDNSKKGKTIKDDEAMGMAVIQCYTGLTDLQSKQLDMNDYTSIARLSAFFIS